MIDDSGNHLMAVEGKKFTQSALIYTVQGSPDLANNARVDFHGDDDMHKKRVGMQRGESY